MDNYYHSPHIADILVSRKQCFVYGSVKANHKNMPLDLKKSKLKIGEIKAYQKGKLTVLRWKDKKDAVLLSSMHTNQTVTVEKRGELKI